MPAADRRLLWRLYRELRKALTNPGSLAAVQAGTRLAQHVEHGVPYNTASLALKLAHLYSVNALKRDGANSRSQRALSHEAFHLTRLAFRAKLGLRELPSLESVTFGTASAPCWFAYSDGSVKGQRSAVGIVLREPQSGREATLSLKMPLGSPLTAELLAARLALQTLLALGARAVHLHTDSQGVLRAFERRLHFRFCLEEAALENLVLRFDAVTVTLIPRLYNHEADRLAARL